MSLDEQRFSKSESENEARRSFLAKLSIMMSGLIGMVMVLPGIGFVVAPALRRSKQKWRSVGKVEEFTVGSTVLVSYEDPSPESWAGVTAKTGAWLRRVSEKEFIAFSINCRPSSSGRPSASSKLSSRSCCSHRSCCCSTRTRKRRFSRLLLIQLTIRSQLRRRAS